MYEKALEGSSREQDAAAEQINGLLGTNDVNFVRTMIGNGASFDAMAERARSLKEDPQANDLAKNTMRGTLGFLHPNDINDAGRSYTSTSWLADYNKAKESGVDLNDPNYSKLATTPEADKASDLLQRTFDQVAKRIDKGGDDIAEALFGTARATRDGKSKYSSSAASWAMDAYMTDTTAENKAKLDEFTRFKTGNTVVDKDGHVVYLAQSEWFLNTEIANNPDIKFHFSSEIHK
jgi:hypothetical protein